MNFNLLSLKSSLTSENFAFISQFLANCPNAILNSMTICTYGPNHTLMYTGDPSEEVYLLLKGGIDAVDENVPNIPYTFTELKPVDVVGDYELFSDALGRYVSLRTTCPTMCIRLSSQNYLTWMKQDNNALFMRMQMLMQVLSWETQFHRQYLFLDNETRLVLYLLEECQKKAFRYPHKVKADRERIASKIGCSIRTLNRTVTQLEKQQLIGRNGGKITIEESQHRALKNYIKDSEANMKLTLPKV